MCGPFYLWCARDFGLVHWSRKKNREVGHLRAGAVSKTHVTNLTSFRTLAMRSMRSILTILMTRLLLLIVDTLFEARSPTQSCLAAARQISGQRVTCYSHCRSIAAGAPPPPLAIDKWLNSRRVSVGGSRSLIVTRAPCPPADSHAPSPGPFPAGAFLQGSMSRPNPMARSGFREHTR